MIKYVSTAQKMSNWVTNAQLKILFHTTATKDVGKIVEIVIPFHVFFWIICIICFYATISAINTLFRVEVNQISITLACTI